METKLTEKEALSQYGDMLDELYPLDGISCNAFSVLLARGDSTAYAIGFQEWCDNNNITVAD